MPPPPLTSDSPLIRVQENWGRLTYRMPVSTLPLLESRPGSVRSNQLPAITRRFPGEGFLVSVRRFFHLQLPRTLLASQIGSCIRRGCPRRSNLVAGLFLPERLIAAAARLPRDRPARVLVARCVRPLPVLYEGIAKNVWELLWVRAGSAGPVDPVRRPVDGRSHNLGRRGSPVLPAWVQGAHR